MKQIKVIATMFIIFSAGLVNYHDHSRASVNFFNESEMVVCADSKNISKNPALINFNYQTKEIKPCTNTDMDDSGADQMMSSGKNYEATMVIM
jgi:hypothetical protein